VVDNFDGHALACRDLGKPFHHDIDGGVVVFRNAVRADQRINDQDIVAQ